MTYMVIIHSRYSSAYIRWMKFPHWNQTIIVGHRRAVFTWLRVTRKRIKLTRYYVPFLHTRKSSGRPIGNQIKTNLQQQRCSWWDTILSWTWRGAFLRQPNDSEIISCLWGKGRPSNYISIQVLLRRWDSRQRLLQSKSPTRIQAL